MGTILVIGIIWTLYGLAGLFGIHPGNGDHLTGGI